jgi:hypothetical protein
MGLETFPVGNRGNKVTRTDLLLREGKMKNNFSKVIFLLLSIVFYCSESSSQGITPNIIVQPINQKVAGGETISFCVGAVCNKPIGFQWWNGQGGQWNNGDKNGRVTIVSNSVISILTIKNVNAAEDHNNKFLCEVKT